MRQLIRVAVAAMVVLVGAASAHAADPVPLPDGIIASNVTISGVPVGGLSVDQARAQVLGLRVAPRLQPMMLSLQGRTITVKPSAAGYQADVEATLGAALAYGRTKPSDVPVDVPLVQSVDQETLRSLLTYRAKEIEISPKDAALRWNGNRPKVIPSRRGLGIKMTAAVKAVSAMMLARTQDWVALPWMRLHPNVHYIGPVIVVNRSARKLTLYRGEKVVRVFPVAVGTRTYPTPRGLFRIIQMQKNPTWIPPDSPWAKGLGPVPPGAGNPLGTRWMGTSASAVGIHGTPAAYSIGTAASHGCIRMYIRDAEWLYRRVNLGTPVRIV